MNGVSHVLISIKKPPFMEKIGLDKSSRFEIRLLDDWGLGELDDCASYVGMMGTNENVVHTMLSKEKVCLQIQGLLEKKDNSSF